jgi:hypothetical protein
MTQFHKYFIFSQRRFDSSNCSVKCFRYQLIFIKLDLINYICPLVYQFGLDSYASYFFSSDFAFIISFFFKFYFIVFTGTYMYIHYLGHLISTPPSPPPGRTCSLGVVLLDHMANLCLVFKKPPYCFPYWLY